MKETFWSYSPPYVECVVVLSQIRIPDITKKVDVWSFRAGIIKTADWYLLFRFGAGEAHYYWPPDSLN